MCVCSYVRGASAISAIAPRGVQIVPHMCTMLMHVWLCSCHIRTSAPILAQPCAGKNASLRTGRFAACQFWRVGGCALVVTTVVWPEAPLEPIQYALPSRVVWRRRRPERGAGAKGTVAAERNGGELTQGGTADSTTVCAGGWVPCLVHQVRRVGVTYRSS